MPYYDLAVKPELGSHVSELAIAVCGLVQIHEVHIDRVPRQVPIELRVEVQKRFRKDAQAANPHLRRREGVHPRDYAYATTRGVRIGAELRDRVGRRQNR